MPITSRAAARFASRLVIGYTPNRASWHMYGFPARALVGACAGILLLPCHCSSRPSPLAALVAVVLSGCQGTMPVRARGGHLPERRGASASVSTACDVCRWPPRALAVGHRHEFVNRAAELLRDPYNLVKQPTTLTAKAAIEGAATYFERVGESVFRCVLIPDIRIDARRDCFRVIVHV